MKKTKAGNRSGFTLVEIMISVFIFSLVMAALSVIYSTAYRQGTRMLRDMKLKGMAIVALRTMENQLQSATRLDKPAVGTAGDVIEGFKNYGPTYDPASPYKRLTDSEEVSWFHYCLSDAIPGKCDVTLQHQPRCLWGYTGAGTSVGAIDCGTTSGGVLLASLITNDPAWGSTGFFSRSTTHGVDERNQVRVHWWMQIPATNTQPMLQYKVDSTFSLHFSE
jgi:prepilin-type N-terminal cleavage/methylation domain-containing protein